MVKDMVVALLLTTTLLIASPFDTAAIRRSRTGISDALGPHRQCDCRQSSEDGEVMERILFIILMGWF